MRLSSPEFIHEGSIPSKFTCDGDNINPQLSIAEVPLGTQSLVLIVDDPDAPVGLWVHWIVYNIPPGIDSISEDAAISWDQGLTSFKRKGYGGPCPPDGKHRYFFTLYALDVDLELGEAPTKDMVEQAMEGHVLDQAVLMGRYTRT